MKTFEIEIEGVVGAAELLEDNAPKTTAAFWDGLPITARLMPAKWSGQACVLPVERLGSVGGLEHGVCSIYPGTLLARPQKGEVLLAYGPSECRSVLGVEYGTRIGRLVTNRAAVLAVLARTHDEGAKTITIRRTGGG